jgi:hypothetical protein
VECDECGHAIVRESRLTQLEEALEAISDRYGPAHWAGEVARAALDGVSVASLGSAPSTSGGS